MYCRKRVTSLDSEAAPPRPAAMSVSPSSMAARFGHSSQRHWGFSLLNAIVIPLAHRSQGRKAIYRPAYSVAYTMDPTLRVSPRAYLPACLPARLALAAALAAGPPWGARLASAVLALAFVGLSAKRERVRAAGLTLWKDYDRLPLLGAAAVLATLEGTWLAPAALAVVAAGASHWHPAVGYGLLAGAGGATASLLAGWGSPARCAAAAIVVADAAAGLQTWRAK